MLLPNLPLPITMAGYEQWRVTMFFAESMRNMLRYVSMILLSWTAFILVLGENPLGTASRTQAPQDFKSRNLPSCASVGGEAM